tara:strand:+ start:889 stop:1200 length:312 start_codon:yes stop_codon:yes gene_type:complete
VLSAFEAYRFIDCQLIAACGHDSPKVLIPNKDTIEQPCEQVRAGFFADAQQHGMHHLITPRYSYLLPEFYPTKQFIGKVDNMAGERSLVDSLVIGPPSPSHHL